MNVGLLFEYPTVNGGENSMLAVAKQLSQSGDVTFCALAPEMGSLAVLLDRAGVPRIPFSVFHEGLRRDRGEQAAEVARLAAATELDLLHANSLSMGRLLGAASDQLPCPTTAHLRDILKLSRTAMQDLNRNARLIAVSEATRQFHVERGLKANRTVMIHNGIDADAYVKSAFPSGQADSPASRVSVRDAVRAEFQIPDESFTLLSVGQIGIRKGLDVLAEAAVLISRSFVPAPIHVLLVGARFSGKAESIEFERIVRQRFRDAGPHVVLHPTGYRDDIARLMLGADSLVHTARQEPLGRVLLEASAVGLPIIATNVGGTSEILNDGESALLIPPDHPLELRNAIARLQSDFRLRCRLQTAAASNVRSRFSVTKAADRLLTEWKKLTTGVDNSE